MASNIERSQEFFNKLSKETMVLVDDFYDPQIVFEDPVHKLSGLQPLKDYYKNLYENVVSIRFDFKSAVESKNVVALEWQMVLVTPSLNSGKEITVDGSSFIEFGANGKAIRHRDYFDMGEFVYERIPLLRSIVGYIKNRLGGS